MFFRIIVLLAALTVSGIVGCLDAEDADRDAARVQRVDAAMRAQVAQDNLDSALERAIQEAVPALPVGKDGGELPDPDQGSVGK